MVRRLQVVIDNLQQVYFPGQYVAGKVILTISKELKVKDIMCRLQGFAKVYWTEKGQHEFRTVYKSQEVYCDQTITVLQSDENGAVLPPETYTYAFTAQIPLGVPASFESDTGRVRYQVIADVNMDVPPHMQAKHVISVMNPLDLNIIPNLSTGVKVKDQMLLGCLCCKSGPIIAEVTVDRQGFVPGEAIPFRLEIENHSNEDLSFITAALVMKALYITSCNDRTDDKTITKIRHGKIEAGETRTWHGKLHIPAVPPSFLAGCNIIDIGYFVTIVVVMPGFSVNMCLPVKVTIGSIPLRHVAEHHGLVLPSAAPPSYEEATTSAVAPPPSDIYNGPPIPPTLPSNMTFAESALGPVSADNAEEHTKDYAPVYTYYNWDQPDTSELFSVHHRR